MLIFLERRLSGNVLGSNVCDVLGSLLSVVSFCVSRTAISSEPPLCSATNFSGFKSSAIPCN